MLLSSICKQIVLQAAACGIVHSAHSSLPAADSADIASADKQKQGQFFLPLLPITFFTIFDTLF